MSISIIIPTLNEESCLGETLRSVRAQRPTEIIVVDGGSSDTTVQLASSADRVVQSPRGRAVQMNAGAAQAHGELLLFMHADCQLEPGALDEMAVRLRRRDISSACFRMTVQSSGMLYRLIDWCATARVRLTGIAYGDQGLAVRRETFVQLGGFPLVPLMEDVLFSCRLRRQGRVDVLRSRILVSPRRWQRAGLLRQTLRNWTLTAGAAAGVDPRRLAAYYPVVR